MNAKEKRAAPRRPLHYKVAYRSGTLLGMGRIIDISAHGVRIAVPRLSRVGGVTLFCEVGKGQVVRVCGYLTWSYDRDHGSVAGVRFENPSDLVELLVA